MAKVASNTISLAVLALGAVAVVGCNDCDFEAKQIERFLAVPANQACQVDSDCVVESVPACLEVDVAFCGQITLSRSASQSSQWQELRSDADGCSKSCEECGALRVPSCNDGACSR